MTTDVNSSEESASNPEHDRLPEPTLSGVTDVLLRERASAMPDHVFKPRADVQRSETQAPLPLSLATLQHWFHAVVTHPKSVVEGVRAAHAIVSAGRGGDDALQMLPSIVPAGPTLAPEDRLDLYHFGYQARLIECLTDDYPVLSHAMGGERWDGLCRAYIEHHPSRSPSLNGFGAWLPAFAFDQDDENAAFYSDLAKLEWALVETIHAEEGGAIDPSTLATFPEDRWGDARFVKSPKARILSFDYPVNAYYQAFYDEQEPEIPQRGLSSTAIYRQKFIVWRMDLTPSMTGVLSSLFRGEPLGEALAAVEECAEDEAAQAEAERSVMVWFREWIRSGFFERVFLKDDAAT